MAFKMKGHSLPGINQRKPGAPKCAAGGPGDGCGGDFKVNKKGTVVSRALKKAGKWVKGGLDNAVSDIKKSNKKRKKKRNTVKGKGSLPRTLDTNPNFVNDYNPETRSKEVLDKIAKHEY
jgi:hypothetical protein